MEVEEGGEGEGGGGGGGGASSSSLSAAAEAYVAARGEGGAPAPAPAPGAPPAFSVAGFPGAERLTQKEAALCEHLCLTPLQYQQIKATVVNIALVRGLVRPGDAEAQLVHVDAAKIGGVYDFVISAGWAKGV
jgi:hypothetical protein